MKWPVQRAVVAGDSMVPTLHDGDRVLVRRRSSPHGGQIVVAQHPHRSGLLLVKRLTAAPGEVVYGAPLGEDEYWLGSDNLLAAPDDSRTFGPVAADAIVGVVLLRYRPVRRSRRNGAASASESKT